MSWLITIKRRRKLPAVNSKVEDTKKKERSNDCCDDGVEALEEQQKSAHE